MLNNHNISSSSMSAVVDGVDDDEERTMTMARRMNAGRRRGNENDPFRVRLTPPRRSTRYTDGRGDDDDDDDDEIIIDANNRNNADIASMPSRGMKNKTAAVVMVTRRDDNKLPTTSAIRQRMPLGGGYYGGMFDSYNDDRVNDGNNNNEQRQSNEDDRRQTDHVGTNHNDDDDDDDNNNNNNNDGDDDKSSMDDGSVLTKYFRRNRTRIGGIGGGSCSVSSSLNYSLMGRRGRTKERMHDATPLLLPTKILFYYARLPYRARQFIQLFAFIATLMIGMMNYLIILDTSSSMPNYHGGKGGGGGMIMQQQYAKRNKKVRFHDPLMFKKIQKYIHHDRIPNNKNEMLLNRAMEKIGLSKRFKNIFHLDDEIADDNNNNINKNDGDDVSSSGPFIYGWKSMPPLIYGDYLTGLEDGTKTITHPNAAAIKDTTTATTSSWGTVAYVLTIPSCYNNKEFGVEVSDNDTHSTINDVNIDHISVNNIPYDDESFRDFAIMLRAQIHANSIRNVASSSKYDYEMIAIIHINAVKCHNNNNNDSIDRTVLLQNLGYRVIVKEVSPIKSKDIIGSEYLQNYLTNMNLDSNQVEDDIPDLIRLYAYELEGYDAVALVDYDTLILRPVDEIVDLIVTQRQQNNENIDNNNNNSANTNSNGVDAVFSWKHLPSLVNPQVRASVINLSFFLLRPSKLTFNDLVHHYQTAPFSETRGWGTHGRGSFPGWMTTQGFLTYYYDEVANTAKIEMNRCTFGNTGEEYNTNNSILFTAEGKVDCGNGDNHASQDDGQCKDCSKSKFEDISVADLSYCRAPWKCCGVGDDDANNPGVGDDEGTISVVSKNHLLSSGLCRQYQRSWFNGRLQMEDVHPQLQKGDGKLCIDGKYQPMVLMKTNVEEQAR